MLKRGDKVRVKATGAEEKVTNVSPSFFPPIWCTDGGGYVESDLELIEAAAVPKGTIRVERVCVYSMEIETDDPQEALQKAKQFAPHEWDEEWQEPKVVQGG